MKKYFVGFNSSVPLCINHYNSICKIKIITIVNKTWKPERRLKNENILNHGIILHRVLEVLKKKNENVRSVSISLVKANFNEYLIIKKLNFKTIVQNNKLVFKLGEMRGKIVFLLIFQIFCRRVLFFK